NGQASSIRIYGRARVIVYSEEGFRGLSNEFTSDVPDLVLRAVPGGHTWNDRVHSLRVISDFERVAPPAPAPGPVVNNYPRANLREGVCVYEHPDYEGREQCWQPGDEVVDLERGRLNDRISSIRVFGGARAFLYRDANFRGERLIVDRDIPDLA